MSKYQIAPSLSNSAKIRIRTAMKKTEKFVETLGDSELIECWGEFVEFGIFFPNEHSSKMSSEDVFVKFMSDIFKAYKLVSK